MSAPHPGPIAGAVVAARAGAIPERSPDPLDTAVRFAAEQPGWADRVLHQHKDDGDGCCHRLRRLPTGALAVRAGPYRHRVRAIDRR